MLTTPKIPDSAGGIISPKFLAYSSSRMTSSSGAGETNGLSRMNGCDDMLTTPVLTTPNTADLWSGSKRGSADFSPENLSAGTDVDLVSFS
jgi:hypothetical protein